jgi:AraC-like DNA-binding protein
LGSKPSTNRGHVVAEVSRELRCGVPGPELRGSVLGYRGFRFGAQALRRRLVVPDGIVKVVLGFGGPLQMVDAVDPRRVRSARSLANGLGTTATVGRHRGRVYGVTVLMTPLAAYRIFAVPMDEWAELAPDPADLLGRAADLLTERLAGCPDWPSRFALLDRFLAARLRAGPRNAPEVGWAWRELQRTAGRLRVEGLAAGAGWSRRHLDRRFREQIGPSPKAVAQILRLQQALRLQRRGMPWAQAASGAGYHDQPHFDRTFKAMIGCTPTRFDAGRSAGDPAGSLDFLPGQVTGILLTR